MLHSVSIFHVIFLIFFGAAFLATIALFTRQSLLVAYMLLGAVAGPWGLHLAADSSIVRQIGDIGIIFLLFLMGLDLQPINLYNTLRKMSGVTLISSVIFFVIGYATAYIFGLDATSCALVGTTMMFSSTIISLKLLPTTALHHRHIGVLMISILLLQDLIAIGAMMMLRGIADREFSFQHLGLILTAFPTLIIVAYIFQRFILTKLFFYFDKVHEYIFILSIGWCLCMGELASAMGLSEEIGAFIAGVTLAVHPISRYIAESLKPLRDFFLVIFFFAIGAEFDFSYFAKIALPASILAALMIFVKPYVFRLLFQKFGERKTISFEIGVRLGQLSEFSLLVIYLAFHLRLIPAETNYLVQAATIITFIASSYWVTLKFPTPLAAVEKLRRN